MELTNEFNVKIPVDEAWEVLTDVTRIAPAMPGAKLETVEGDEYRGVVKVKVGPVTAEYKGAATFLERDPVAHRAVLRAEGRETRGQGNATATITATLAPEGEGTRVSVVTDLSITGRAAQFGRGVLADVSNKLLGQFVSTLETTVLGGASGATASGAGAGENGGPGAESEGVLGVRSVGQGGTSDGAGQLGVAPGLPGGEREVVPVNLVRVVGPVVVKRLLAPLAGLLALVVFWRRRRRRAS
ncbi:MAG: SRPBCC family protein [Acidimicrobiales bacterium]